MSRVAQRGGICWLQRWRNEQRHEGARLGWGEGEGLQTTGKTRKVHRYTVLLTRPDTGQVLEKKRFHEQQAPHTTTSFCEFKLCSHTPNCPAGSGSEGSWSEQSDPRLTETWLCPHVSVGKSHKPRNCLNFEKTKGVGGVLPGARTPLKSAQLKGKPGHWASAPCTGLKRKKGTGVNPRHKSDTCKCLINGHSWFQVAREQENYQPGCTHVCKVARNLPEGVEGKMENRAG